MAVTTRLHNFQGASLFSPPFLKNTLLLTCYSIRLSTCVKPSEKARVIVQFVLQGGPFMLRLGVVVLPHS